MTPDFTYNNFRALHANLFGPCFFVDTSLICLVRFVFFLMEALWSANAIWAYLISQGLYGHGLPMGMRWQGAGVGGLPKPWELRG